MEDVQRMALDVRVVHGRETVDYLQAMLPRREKDDPEIAAALDLFESWSGYATPDNRALYLLTVFCWRWSELEEGPGRLELALRQAIAFADNHHGRIDVPWGEAHGVERGGRWFPSGGASLQRGPVGSLISLHHGEPLNDRPDDRGRFPMEKGSSHIMVAQMTDPPRLWSAKPFGNSEDPSSRHYADLTELFAAGTLRPVWMTSEDIRAHTESVLGKGVVVPLPGGLGTATAVPGSLVELAVFADGDGIRIEETAGRPFSARLELDGVERYRLLAADGTVVSDWREADQPIEINREVVLQIEPERG
jgi:hypothetical protein